MPLLGMLGLLGVSAIGPLLDSRGIRKAHYIPYAL